MSTADHLPELGVPFWIICVYACQPSMTWEISTNDQCFSSTTRHSIRPSQLQRKFRAVFNTSGLIPHTLYGLHNFKDSFTQISLLQKCDGNLAPVSKTRNNFLRSARYCSCTVTHLVHSPETWKKFPRSDEWYFHVLAHRTMLFFQRTAFEKCRMLLVKLCNAHSTASRGLLCWHNTRGLLVTSIGTVGANDLFGLSRKYQTVRFSLTTKQTPSFVRWVLKWPNTSSLEFLCKKMDESTLFVWKERMAAHTLLVDKMKSNVVCSINVSHVKWYVP